jgi:hypothetical protein
MHHFSMLSALFLSYVSTFVCIQVSAYICYLPEATYDKSHAKSDVFLQTVCLHVPLLQLHSSQSIRVRCSVAYVCGQE